jgi:uncharacterized protein DUF3800
LFTRTGYAQLYREWKKTVLRHGTKRFAHFHMTDLYAGKGVYAGVTIPERVEIFENAITAISKNIYASIGVHFNQQEFEEVAPLEWSRYFGSIYTAACHMSIQATAYGLREWRSSEKVHYTFESGHRFRAQANSLMEKIRNDAEAVRNFRYRSHSFEQEDQSFGLQAADLFAWNVVKESFRTVPPSLRPFLLSMGRLASEIKKRQVFFPLTGDRLVAFLDDQMLGTWSRDRHIPLDFGPRKRTLPSTDAQVSTEVVLRLGKLDGAGCTIAATFHRCPAWVGSSRGFSSHRTTGN